MDIQLEKEALIKKLLETNDESIIVAVKKIFKSEKKDWWDELSQEQKEEIEIGIAQADAGEVLDFDTFIKPYL